MPWLPHAVGAPVNSFSSLCFSSLSAKAGQGKPGRYVLQDGFRRPLWVALGSSISLVLRFRESAVNPRAAPRVRWFSLGRASLRFEPIYAGHSWEKWGKYRSH